MYHIYKYFTYTMSTYEFCNYIREEEDDRFDPNLDQSVVMSFKMEYPELFCKLNKNNYNPHPISTNENKLVCENKASFIKYVKQGFRNIVCDLCTLGEEYNPSIITLKKNDNVFYFVNWTDVVRIALTKFDNLVSGVGISCSNLRIKYIREDLYNLIVKLCSHYHDGMDIGLKMNYTNVCTWNERFTFDQMICDNSLEHNMEHIGNVLAHLHADDRQSAITAMYNSFDELLEHLLIVFRSSAQLTQSSDDEISNITEKLNSNHI